MVNTKFKFKLLYFQRIYLIIIIIMSSFQNLNLDKITCKFYINLDIILKNILDKL